MRSLFGVSGIAEIPPGVDTKFFASPAAPPAACDLVFIGSMDWLPNIDGMLHFVRETLPLIRRRRPDCTLAIVGRAPSAEISELARRDPKIQVTGTVPDVRPFLWASA